MSCKSFEAIAEENTREFPPACEKRYTYIYGSAGTDMHGTFELNGKEIEVTNCRLMTVLEWLRETGQHQGRLCRGRLRRLHHCNLR